MARITYLSVKKGTPAKGYWDQEFVKDILKDIGESDRHVFIIPGAYQGDEDSVKKINKKLNVVRKVLVFITGDEEGKFSNKFIKHDDAIIYSQCGNGGFMFPLGYPPNTRETLKKLGYRKKNMKWFFAGQITHPRREGMAVELRKMDDGNLIETDGFGKGVSHADYLEQMSESKVVLCSSGAVTVDSFRIYEALEAGCIPVADDMSPLKSYSQSYWHKLFSGVPFGTYVDYTDIPKLINQAVTYQNYGNKVFAWWISKKHQFREQIKRDLGIPKDDMIVVVPVSPIKSHPDTSILDETLKSIRAHTDAPIIVTFDGVRDEQEDKRKDYEEFIRRMLWKINFEYENILPVIFDKHTHQVGMMRKVLEQTDVPMILYVEQDTPLLVDREIDWDKCKEYIKSGKANVIRFHFEEVIPEPHKHLMVGEVEDGMQRTVQWSQRPHLASREIYRVITSLFIREANCFIEDYLHGAIQDIWNEQGMKGWNKWKIWIYHPEGGIKRSSHTDGREGGEKYVEEQKW